MKKNPLILLKNFLQKDPRYFQILYLGMFLMYGIFGLDWDVEIGKYAAVFAAGLGAQMLGAWLTNKNWGSWKSAMITCIGICLLLKGNGYWPLAVAAALSIGSKFLIKAKGKHIWNPSGFGIIVALLLTGEVWISPGQWGSSAILLYFFGAAALMMLLRVGRIDTSITFLLTFGGLELIRSVFYQGWPMDFWLHKLTNGSLLLFAFFMITDPVTTPNASKARIIWAVGIGVASFCMTNWFYVHTAPIWALFFFGPATVLLDRYFIAPKFKWQKEVPKSEAVLI